MSAALAAAHVSHEIEHSSAMMGFLVGAAVGLGVAVFVAATVLTGGATLAVVAAVGGIVAATGGGALAGMALGGISKNPRGAISAGSANVKYGPARLPAARVDIDLVGCLDHGPKLIATGSDSVFINNFPAVRHDDKTVCDGTIKSDLTHIGIGAETVQYLEIEGEVPAWMIQLAQGMVIVGGAVALGFGAAAAYAAGGLCSLVAFGGTAAGGFLGGLGGAYVGGELGYALGGDDGRVIGEIFGGMAGGIFGAKMGNRYSTGHPVDVATGELFTSEIDFTVPGLIPLVWERFWISSSTQNAQLGHRWHHSYDMMIAEGTDNSLLRMEYGRLILLPALKPGERFYHRAEKLTVIRDEAGDYTVLTEIKNRLTFKPSVTDPAHHALATMGDFNGNVVTLSYTEDGYLHRITNCAGVALHFDLDHLGRMTKVTKTHEDVSVPLVSYSYDDHGNLASATNGTGTPFTYHYENHLLTKETRRSGLSFYFEWNDIAFGRAAKCVKTWGDDNIYFRTIAYDADERSAHVVDSHGQTTVYFANKIGLIKRIITPLGHEAIQSYNAYAELLKMQDPEGNSLTAIYDDFGRVTTFTDKNGASTTYAYVNDRPDSPNFHNIQIEVDPLGYETRFAYDQNGNIAKVSDPLHNEVGFLRNERGLPLAIRDDEGTLARMRWSQDGDLLEERSSKGGRHLYTYDVFGRIVTEQRERDGIVRYSYDALGQLREVQHHDGTATRLAYDVEGNVSQFTDPVGRSTAWHFGRLPFPQRRTNPDGSVFDYRYDTELNLVQLRNEVGETYQLDYDADGNLSREIGFDGREQAFHYDGAGNVIRAVDGHRQHQFVRDPVGRLLSRHSSDGQSATYEYDAAGQMIKADNAARKLAFGYDPRGLLIEETQDRFTTTHAHSSRGQRTATLLPDGRNVRFGYDQDGAFSSLRYLDRDVLNIRRDQLGREKERQAGGVLQRTDYDPQGRINQQKAYKSGQQNPIFGRSYGYDPSGLINEIRDSARGVRRYQYDAREQLRAVSGDASERFAFDPAGNILGDIANPMDASVKGGRLLMQGDNHYTYDDAGNRIRLERGWGGVNALDYAYDHQNQLISVTETLPARLKVTHFAYDALGRRVSKHFREERRNLQAANQVVPPPDGDIPNPLIKETVTRFLWNGDVLLAEGTGDASGIIDPLALVYIYEPDSFRPAAQIRRVTPDDQGHVYIYWLDHLGTPQEITNEAGELVWQVALKAWGGIDRVFVKQVGNNLRFQGQYHDHETGLHYNRFRHYDPAVGCFVNQDPIGLWGGEINALYAPNPSAWVDPFGLNRWHDWLKDNPGQTTSQASPGYQAANPPTPSTGTVHGNSHASTRPTVGYVIKERGTGRVLKFGETSNPNPRARYSQGWYNQHNAEMKVVKIGTKAEMHKWQNERILQYKAKHGGPDAPNEGRPSLNKCNF